MKKTYMILSAAFVLCTSTLFGAASDDLKSDVSISGKEASYNDNQCGPWHRPISPHTFDRMANMQETRLKLLEDASSRALEASLLLSSTSTCESKLAPLTQESPVASSSEQHVQWWDNASVQDANGVRIESFFEDTYGGTRNPTASFQVARLIPWRLALTLKSDTVYESAIQAVKDELLRFEIERSANYQAAAKGWQIRRMLIKIALKKSGVSMRVEGDADRETFVTFFPDYSFVREDQHDSKLPGSSGAGD